MIQSEAPDGSDPVDFDRSTGGLADGSLFSPLASRSILPVSCTGSSFRARERRCLHSVKRSTSSARFHSNSRSAGFWSARVRAARTLLSISGIMGAIQASVRCALSRWRLRKRGGAAWGPVESAIGADAARGRGRCAGRCHRVRSRSRSSSRARAAWLCFASATICSWARRVAALVERSSSSG